MPNQQKWKEMEKVIKWNGYNVLIILHFNGNLMMTIYYVVAC
jgi:hypothetical protein